MVSYYFATQAGDKEWLKTEFMK